MSTNAAKKETVLTQAEEQALRAYLDTPRPDTAKTNGKIVKKETKLSPTDEQALRAYLDTPREVLYATRVNNEEKFRSTNKSAFFASWSNSSATPSVQLQSSTTGTTPDQKKSWFRLFSSSTTPQPNPVATAHSRDLSTSSQPTSTQLLSDENINAKPTTRWLIADRIVTEDYEPETSTKSSISILPSPKDVEQLPPLISGLPDSFLTPKTFLEPFFSVAQTSTKQPPAQQTPHSWKAASPLSTSQKSLLKSASPTTQAIHSSFSPQITGTPLTQNSTSQPPHVVTTNPVSVNLSVNSSISNGSSSTVSLQPSTLTYPASNNPSSSAPTIPTQSPVLAQSLNTSSSTGLTPSLTPTSLQTVPTNGSSSTAPLQPSALTPPVSNTTSSSAPKITTQSPVLDQLSKPASSTSLTPPPTPTSVQTPLVVEPTSQTVSPKEIISSLSPKTAPTLESSTNSSVPSLETQQQEAPSTPAVINLDPSLTPEQAKKILEYTLPLVVAELSEEEEAALSLPAKNNRLLAQRQEKPLLEEAIKDIEIGEKDLADCKMRIAQYLNKARGSGEEQSTITLSEIRAYKRDKENVQAIYLRILRKIYPKTEAEELQKISEIECLALGDQYILLARERIKQLKSQSPQPVKAPVQRDPKTQMIELKQKLKSADSNISNNLVVTARTDKTIARLEREMAPLLTEIINFTAQEKDSSKLQEEYDAKEAELQDALLAKNGNTKAGKPSLETKLAGFKKQRGDLVTSITKTGKQVAPEEIRAIFTNQEIAKFFKPEERVQIFSAEICAEVLTLPPPKVSQPSLPVQGGSTHVPLMKAPQGSSGGPPPPPPLPPMSAKPKAPLTGIPGSLLDALKKPNSPP